MVGLGNFDSFSQRQPCEARRFLRRDLGVLVAGAEELLDVLARAERVARAGQHHDLGVVVHDAVVERVVHVEVQLRAHRVALLGPVHDDERDAVLVLELHGLVGAELGHASPPRSAFQRLLSVRIAAPEHDASPAPCVARCTACIRLDLRFAVGDAASCRAASAVTRRRQLRPSAPARRARPPIGGQPLRQEIEQQPRLGRHALGAREHRLHLQIGAHLILEQADTSRPAAMSASTANSGSRAMPEAAAAPHRAPPASCWSAAPARRS